MKEGTRSGLWYEMLRATDALRPRYVIIENVRGLLSGKTGGSEEVVRIGPKGGRKVEHTRRAMGRVLSDLADLGYDARWYGLRAADVGAPHGRFRVFVVAYPAHLGHEWCRPSRGWRPGPADGGSGPVDLLPTPTTQDGSNNGGPSQFGRNSLSIEAARSEQQWGKYADAIARWESLTRPAPAPTEPTGRNGAARLSPRFTEWMMGAPEGWITDVPGLTRNEALKACGNGVVPQQAAFALSAMLSSGQPVAEAA